MKQILLSKTNDKIVGAVRVSAEIFVKIEKMAKENKVSNQEIIRAILANFIDEAKFI